MPTSCLLMMHELATEVREFLYSLQENESRWDDKHLRGCGNGVYYKASQIRSCYTDETARKKVAISGQRGSSSPSLEFQEKLKSAAHPLALSPKPRRGCGID